MPVPPDPPRSAPRKTCRYLPIRPVLPLAKHAGTSRSAPFRPSQNMPVPPDPPRSAPRKTCRYLPIRPVPPLAKHAGTSRSAPFRPSQNMPVPPDPPRSAPRKTCRYLPIRPVPPLAKHAGTSRSAPQWTHSFSARFRSVWREFGNKTFLNYYGTLPVSFVYSLLSAPRGTWSEIWFFFFFFFFFNRFVIDLQQLCRTSRVTHSLLYFWMI